MMALEFMTGAAVFALVNLVIIVAAVYLLYRVIRKISKADYNIKVEVTLAAILLLTTVSFGSVSQPKLSISTPINRDLIEYQTKSPEITIETPPPRTEKLKGFKPLNEEN